MTDIERLLLIENNELRFRLAENKMLIDASKKDETGGNIVSRGDCFENTVLSSLSDPYRIIIGEMKEGACIISKDDTILLCNQLFADIFSCKKEDITGSDISSVIGELDKNIFDFLLQARKKGKSGKMITIVTHPDIIRHFFLTANLLSNTSDNELLISFTDVTEIRENRITNEVLLNNARLAALNIMEDEIIAKNELAKTNCKLLDEINERKKSEIELQQSKLNLLEAQKLAHIGNWSYDYKLKQPTFSEEIYHIIGLDPKLGIKHIEEIRKLIHPDQWKIIFESVRKVTEEGIISEFEFQIHRITGEHRNVYAICTPEFNAAGKTIKVNGTIQDITERKKSEEELIKVNRLYTVISLINQMIIRNQVRETIFTEACNIVIEHGKFRMVWIGLLDENGEFVTPITWAGAEMGYLSSIKKISAKNRSEGNGPTGTAIRNREIYYCNDISTDPNMAIWKEMALERDYRASIAVPIIVFNKVIGAFTIYVSEANFFNQAEIDLLQQVTSDISFALEVTETEKKRIAAEKEINRMNIELEQRVALRTQQLEYANKELEAFTYSVSHDLRAPLRNINGWGQVLHEEFKDQLGVDGLKYMDRVISETLRMNNLIDDLLKLSRVTMAERKRERVDLTAITQTIAHRLQDKPINYKLEIIIQPNLMTIGDARMLDIALTNLLENSYKFTGKLPHARIEFGMTMIEGKPTYWVKDNGVGFDMENSKNLFGVFQRMHNQNEFPGTGIGLATVQRIIHRHNGIIWADSRINEGTTFFFTIPNVNL
jgi:signal transduction histidine kinase/PAS domain-containing protein